MVIPVLLSFISLFSIVTSDKHSALPLVYQIEDFNACLEKNYVYCKSDAMLQCTSTADNNLWRQINDSTKGEFIFARNLIHRGICVPQTDASDLQSIKHFTEQRINDELKKVNLISSVKKVTCITQDEAKTSSAEVKFWSGFIIYLFFVLCATLYDISKKSDENKEKTIGHKIITSFSLTSNWKKVCETTGNEDYTKLKSIQGIRVLIMLIVVGVHSLFSFNLIYVSNPEELEKMYSFTVIRIMAVFAVFVVQVFLLVSSWLLTIQIYNHYKKNGEFTLKEVFILIINRFFRLGVCSTIVIGILQLSWIPLIDGPITFDNLSLFQTSCKNNWWQTFAFVNNRLNFGDICHPVAWYLAVDFQLYILALITFYVIFKFKLNEWKVISSLLLLSIVLYGTIIYSNEADVVWRTNLNAVRRYYFIQSPEANILYLSTYSSWTTSLIGISSGIIYMKYKNNGIINNSDTFSLLWALLTFGLPSIAMFTASHKFHGITSAVLGPLMKPLFATGVAVGILGMSHNIGGIARTIKRIFENDYVAVISNFSYSVYIFQTLIIFSKGAGSYSLMKLDLVQMLMYTIFLDIPLTMIFGIIGALLFEQPGISLQKILLPQLRRKVQPSQKNE